MKILVVRMTWEQMMAKLIVTMRVHKRTKKEKKPNPKRTKEQLPNQGNGLQVKTI